MPHTTEPVARIAAPSPEEFRRDFLETQTPVILTGLLAGQPIDQIRDEADARAQIGWLRIPVATEYLHAVSSSGRADAPQSMRLDEYLAMQQTSPGTHRMCSEQPTPQALLARLQLPEYDAYEDAISSFFVGHAGHWAHMHFDGDYRNVLFHQVFGTKKFIFVSPGQYPLLPAIGNFAEWAIEHFSDEEQARFLAFTGGVACTLHAGETLFIPASIWHFVGYTTTSMSINVRFGRNAYTRFLAEHVHLSKFTQAIAWKLSNAATVSPEALAVYRDVVNAAEAEYASAEAQYEAMELLLEKAADTMYGRTIPRSISSANSLRAIYRDGSIARYAALQQTTGAEVAV